MRTTITSLFGALILMLTSSSINAQTDGMLGLKAGMNVSSLTINNSVNRTGFHAGLFYRSTPTKPLGFQAELLYSQRGAEWGFNLFNLVSQKASVGLNYVDLPVMAVYRPLSALELHAGAYASYLLSSDYNASGTLINEQGSLGYGNFNAFDFGALVGVAVNIGPVQVGARYNFGMMKVSNSTAANFLLGDAKNRYGQLYLAYIFPVTK